MMPGETHSKTAGIASEAAGSCQNCTSLQQSLNEYVAALIGLKQKIIDSDQLLAEYQQKCDDLQYAERENGTLRCQLEQMLQKVSPQEQHQEQLISLKAELDEKTSSLKIYQQTQMEYMKVKEECEKIDVAKKKLEAKLKRMEEAAAKHDKDYKQLKMEKRVIGKELKKIQKKLDDFQSQKSKKVAMKNAQTQFAREEPVVKIDKQKIKYLLEEIWGCIESSAENGECNLVMLGNLTNYQLTVPKIKIRENKTRKNKRSECKLSARHSSLQISQTCNPTTELDTVQEAMNLSEPKNSPMAESAVVEISEDFVSDKDETLDVSDSKDFNDRSSVNCDSESDMDEISEVQKWATPLPNLLSPIQCSPLTIQNMFGEFTDTSDAESSSDVDQLSVASPVKIENTHENGTDENSTLNQAVDHTFCSTECSFAVKSIASCSDGPDLTMEVETSQQDLVQNIDILPLQDTQPVTANAIDVGYEERSNLTNRTLCLKDTLTDTLKESNFNNQEFSKGSSAEAESIALSMHADNGYKETSCPMETEMMLFNNVVYNSAINSPSVNLTKPPDTAGKMKFDNLSSNNESFRCMNDGKSHISEDCHVHHKINPDTVGRPNVTIVDCDQDALVHLQSEIVSENENSSFVTDLLIKPNMSDDGSTITKDASWQNYCNNSVPLDLTKCSEKSLDKTSTILPAFNMSTCPEELCTLSTEKTHPGSISKQPLELRQTNKPLGQTSPVLSSNNPLLTASNAARVIDSEDIKAFSICQESGHMDIKHETHLVLDTSMTGKQNMAISLNECDSITITSMESHCKAIEKKDDDLEKENIAEHKTDLGVDKIASISLCHNDDNQSERSSLQVVDHPSTAINSNVKPISSLHQESDTELQSTLVDTSENRQGLFHKLGICENVISPPTNEHANKCNSRIDTDGPSHQKSNLSNVVSCSPVHIAVDPEHNNDRNTIETQSQEVTKNIKSSMILNSSIPEERTQILCPFSKTGLTVKIKAHPEILPVLPSEDFQHFHMFSKSNDSLEKLEKDTARICDGCLDSSESEYEFPVRKVNFTRPTFHNPIVQNESFKIASDGTKKNDNALLIVTGLEEQHKPPTFTTNESERCIATVVKLQNDSEESKVEDDMSIEPEHSFLHALNIESKNGAASEGNVECSPEERSKVTSSVQEPVRQNEVSTHIRSDSDAETGGRRILPGKNLIWNFSRSDDFVGPKAVCLPRKPKAKSGKVSTSLESSVTRGGAGNEKTKELDPSNKLQSPIFPSARKENPPSNKLPQEGTVFLNAQGGQTVLANSDSDTNEDHSPETTINELRSKMGPPLPPLLGPLLSTPPRSMHTLSPIMSSSSRSSLPSPIDEGISPLPGTRFTTLMSPVNDERKRKSPIFSTPSPVEKANHRILSSPLQFCAATPKHAVPVPGRLPLSANGSSACNVQENSVKILDTMYPELSARARTLNILKGNVQLNRGLSRDGQNVPVSQITGFKSITSTSTVFIKTGSNSKPSNKEKINTAGTQSCTSVSKRATDSFQMPKSAKRLRLDSESPVVESVKDCFPLPAQKADESCPHFGYSESLPDVVKDSNVDEDIINNALKKIQELCFDLLPVIRSHVYVKTIPKVPVMRNEEKEVIFEFSNSKKHLADCFLHVLLKKINTGKRTLDSVYLQALCRVYVGLCRQLGDIERARVLCYSIIKEDFPDPDKLLLFIISSWNDILSLHGVVSKAVQAVLKILAKEDVGSCLSAYLNWEKCPPMNTNVLLNSVLMAIQLYPDVNFHQSEKYGEDLTDNVWEYVFTVDLLCSYHKWLWTHECVISKELWPILDKWVKRKKGNLTIQCVPDVIIATVLRLVGRLCQMGLKEGFLTAVKSITSVIITFIQHANEEGVPWGVQLASVYMLCDTAPCDPSLILQTLQAWKEATKNVIPPAVTNCMQEIASLCVQDK
ncbi:little elongation complex subunit 1 [Anomaloglossus baeobatrachus]|uniref:little elongation complex subunit 1 n=1 Tax=Anomaloglossus baeobatrachus TaxID=238106 RepID=UPI003F4FEA73